MSRKVVRTPSVEFARKGSPASRSGDVVFRRGVIFRAGDYTHQRFSMSPDELRGLVASFSGRIPIDHGHPSVDGPLDFGHLESVDVSPDGTTLYGNTVHPSWVDTALEGSKWLVSASFDRATKAIKRLSLVTRPQISDAELQAAFACACGHAATTKEGRTMPDDYVLTEEERRAVDRLRAVPADERSGVMAVLDGDYEPPDDDEEDEEGGEGTAGEAEFSAHDIRDIRIAELEAKDRRRDAEVFVDGAIKDHLVLPAERARLVARHAQFALDDELAPAQFADGKPLSRVAEFQADIRGRKAHGWGRDVIAGDAGFSRALDPRGDRPETDAEYAARVNKKHYRAGANGAG